MTQTTPQSIDLLIEARWVVPVEPHAVVLENHAVAIDGERIVALLPIDEARQEVGQCGVRRPVQRACVGAEQGHHPDDMSLHCAPDRPRWPLEGVIRGPAEVRQARPGTLPRPAAQPLAVVAGDEALFPKQGPECSPLRNAEMEPHLTRQRRMPSCAGA